jgi:NAD(P)H dehydrogenase (quinone)
MHTLIVTSHPNPDALTHAVARRIAEGITSAGVGATAELADLSAEGFDPRFNQDDMKGHQREAPFPADVLAEQARLDRADALVLVFPVYWWSMPALMKGWIDRVFSNGWAYDDSSGQGVLKKLGHLPIHLVALGGADERTWHKRGYTDAMKIQIETGIFDYCGAPIRSSTLLLETDSGDASAHLSTAYALGRRIATLPDEAAG